MDVLTRTQSASSVNNTATQTKSPAASGMTDERQPTHSAESPDAAPPAEATSRHTDRDEAFDSGDQRLDSTAVDSATETDAPRKTDLQEPVPTFNTPRPGGSQPMQKGRFLMGLLISAAGLSLMLAVAVGTIQDAGLNGRLSLPAVAGCMVIGLMFVGGGFGLMATAAPRFDDSEFDRLASGYVEQPDSGHIDQLASGHTDDRPAGQDQPAATRDAAPDAESEAASDPES